MTEQHSDQAEIAKINAMPRRKDQRNAINILKFKGDHEHNLNVMEKGHGTLVVARKPPMDRIVNAGHYQPCPSCKRWMLRSQLADHQNVCLLKETKPNVKVSKAKLQKQSRHLLIAKSVTKSADGEMTKTEKHLVTLLNDMYDDEIGNICRSDKLIRDVAKTYLCGVIREEEKYRDIREKARTLGRLLIELRKNPGYEKMNLEDFIHVRYYDYIIHTIQRYALDNNKNCTSRKIGYLIERARFVLWERASAAEDDIKLKQLDHFDRLHSKSYTMYVASKSLKQQNSAKLNKDIVMISSNDVSKFITKLKDIIKIGIQDVRNEPTTEKCNELQKATLVHLTSFNR